MGPAWYSRRPPSLALRYWNMARQRHCRRLARYGNTRSVSADPVAKPAAHTRAESRGSGPSKLDAAERQTLCWREMDSNHRSLLTSRPVTENLRLCRCLPVGYPTVRSSGDVRFCLPVKGRHDLALLSPCGPSLILGVELPLDAFFACSASS